MADTNEVARQITDVINGYFVSHGLLCMDRECRDGLAAIITSELATLPREPKWATPKGEDDTACNAAIYSEVFDSVVGPYERERLGRVPKGQKSTTWQSQLVHQLVQRIMNLRLMLAASTARDASLMLIAAQAEEKAREIVGIAGVERPSDHELRLVQRTATALRSVPRDAGLDASLVAEAALEGIAAARTNTRRDGLEEAAQILDEQRATETDPNTYRALERAEHAIRARITTPTSYCPSCDHAGYLDGNGICQATVIGCSTPCGCRCPVPIVADGETLADALKPIGWEEFKDRIGGGEENPDEVR